MENSEMPLTNCEIILDLPWSKKCVLSSAVGKTELKKRGTKSYVHVVTLPTEDNLNLIETNRI